MAERAGSASAEAKAPIPWNEALGKMKTHIKGWEGQGLLDATKVVDDAITVITHPEFGNLSDEGKTGLARGMGYIFQRIPRARGEVQSQLVEVMKNEDQDRFSELAKLIDIGGLDGDKVIASLREQAESTFAQQSPQGSGHATPPWHGRTPAASAPSRPGLIPSKSQLDAEANVEHTSRPAEPTDEELKLLSEKDVEHEAEAPAEPDGGYSGEIGQNGEAELPVADASSPFPADAIASIVGQKEATDLVSAEEKAALSAPYNEMIRRAITDVSEVLDREEDRDALIQAISEVSDVLRMESSQIYPTWDYLNRIGNKLKTQGNFKAAAACYGAALRTVVGDVPREQVLGYAQNFIQTNNRLVSSGADVGSWLKSVSGELTQSKSLIESYIASIDLESDLAKQGQWLVRQVDKLIGISETKPPADNPELAQIRFNDMTAGVARSVIRILDKRDLTVLDFIDAEKAVRGLPGADALEDWEYANRVGMELQKMGKNQVAAAFFRVALDKYQATDHPQPEVIAELTQNFNDANGGTPPPAEKPAPPWEEADHAKSPASVSETRDRILKEWMGELPGALISLRSEQVAELRTRLEKAGVGIPDLKVEAGEIMTVDDVHSLIRKANKLEGFDWGETEVLVNLPEYMRNEEFFANLMESRRDAVVNTRVALEGATSGLGNLRFRRKGRAAEDYRRAVRDLATHQALIDMVKAEAETKNLIVRDALPSFRPLIEITPGEKQVLVEMLRKAMIERRDTVIKGGEDIPEAEFARASLGEPTPNGSKFFFIPRLLDQIYNEGLQNVDDYNSVEFTQKALDVIRQASRQTVIDSLNNMERLEIAYELRIETSAPNWENDSRVRAIYRPMEEVFPSLLK